METVALTEDEKMEAALHVSTALGYIDAVATRKDQEICYETMQRSGFQRKNWNRKYSLADARIDARAAAIALRKAWEILDPSIPK